MSKRRTIQSGKVVLRNLVEIQIEPDKAAMIEK